MKKLIFFSLFTLATLIPELSFGQEGRTEDYAIISVKQYGKKNFISITIGSESTEEKEYQKEKNDKAHDMAPVIEEMEKLNEKGYELFSSNVSIIPKGEVSGGNLFYYFIFIKKR